MKKSSLRCPACDAKVDADSGEDGRYWCTSCDEVFEVPATTAADDDDRPARRRAARRPRQKPASAGGGGALVFALAGVAALVLVGLSIAAYFALNRDEPKPAPGEVAERPAPPREPERPKLPGANEPPKKEPKEEPKPPTPEEVVRRVKGATVYIRATTGPGRVEMGSGFFAGSEPGFVVTNAHVVGYGPREIRRPSKVEVVVAGGEPGERTLSAAVYGVDVEGDLALLKVEGEGLPAPLAFGKAEGLVETQEVVVYGYPFGELLGKNISVNRSSVSSLRRENGKLRVVQLAGGLNPGNSGGPVTNAKGEVIGVSVAKIGGAEIAFAIPAEEANAFAKDQHRAGGRFETGNLVAVGPGPIRPPVRPPVRPPAKPPEEPPAPAAPGTEVKLAAEGDAVCVGGGGHLVFVSLPKSRQVAIFDAMQGKVVKHLPAPAEKVLLAAGLDKLVVVDPATNAIQRWSLTTYEKEATATLPMTAGLKPNNVVMGYGSNGPLLVQGLDWPRLGEWYLFDIATMKEIKGGPNPKRHGPLECSPQDTVWASRDGRTMIVNREQSSSILTNNGDKWVTSNAPWADRRRPGFVSADGSTVYGGKGEMFTSGGKRLGQADRAADLRHYIPATDGPLVLAINDRLDVHEPPRGVSLAVHAPRDPNPLFRLPRFEALEWLFVANVGWHFDGHVFFVSQAKVVAVLPKAKDRIVLYKLDVDEGLKKSDRDYLFVTSHPPFATPGKKFEYQIDAKSKKGEVKYKLDFGPDGLAVSADGKVTWDTPADFDKPATVGITISDKSGQETTHTFDVVPAQAK
jgi:S1-C subfamily serine protease